MDIQEAIEHAKDVANKNYLEGMLCHANPDDGRLDACIECAREHEQIAEWLYELQQYKQLGTLEEVREAVERQQPRKAILKNGKGGMFVDYADGHGEYKVTKWQDWCCPVCGWFVGQRYNASQGKSHDQRKSEYCNECGQHIDWSEEDD